MKIAKWVTGVAGCCALAGCGASSTENDVAAENATSGASRNSTPTYNGSALGGGADLNSQLVGSWAYSDICATDFGITFNADGTYEDFGSDQGRYSFDGKTIKFFGRKSVIELGGDETQFVPEPLGDAQALVRDFNERTMTMNGQTVTKCQD